MRHHLLAAAATLAVLALGAACTGEGEDAAEPQGSAGNVEGTEPPTSITMRPAVGGNTPDPNRVLNTEDADAAWLRYLELAPADAPELTQDDAYIRAWLACSISPAWPAGSVDAALVEAYRPLFSARPDWGC